MSRFLLPRHLSAGGRIAVVAPGGPIERTRLEQGAERLHQLGYTLTYDDGLFAKERYLGGSDAHRLTQLQAALDDHSVSAVWAARGGYGVTRLLPQLSLRGLRERPKLIFGFSDITALHCAFNALGIATVHGPNIGQVGELTEPAMAHLEAVLSTSLPPPALEGATAIVPGVTRGVLLGGNLTLLASLAGTPFLPSFSGAVLLLEDVGERPYRIDRCLTQLQNAGALNGLRGLALGTFAGCEDRASGESVLPVFDELARRLGVPAAIGLPIGHMENNHCALFGAEVELDAGRGRLTFLEGLGA